MVQELSMQSGVSMVTAARSSGDYSTPSTFISINSYFNKLQYALPSLVEKSG